MHRHKVIETDSRPVHYAFSRGFIFTVEIDIFQPVSLFQFATFLHHLRIIIVPHTHIYRITIQLTHYLSAWASISMYAHMQAGGARNPIAT